MCVFRGKNKGFLTPNLTRFSRRKISSLRNLRSKKTSFFASNNTKSKYLGSFFGHFFGHFFPRKILCTRGSPGFSGPRGVPRPDPSNNTKSEYLGVFPGHPRKIPGTKFANFPTLKKIGCTFKRTFLKIL